MGLYYSKESTTSGLVGYYDAGYRSDQHKARSENGYLFCYNDTAISWCSTKHSLVATSSNHSEIIALYEVGRECVSLRSIITHIHNSCCLTPVTNSPTIIYEDNAACVAQVRGGYIKGDRCETPRKSNFLKKGKIIILVKIQNFSRSRMTKRTSQLELSHKSSYHV